MKQEYSLTFKIWPEDDEVYIETLPVVASDPEEALIVGEQAVCAAAKRKFGHSGFICQGPTTRRDEQGDILEFIAPTLDGSILEHL